jgi:hypothetical protein
MKGSRAIRRGLAMVIPATVIAAVAALHWSGEWSRPDAQAAMPRSAPAPLPTPADQPAWRANWPSDAPRRNLFLTRLDTFPRDVGTAQQPIRPDVPGVETKSPIVPTDHIHDAPQSSLQDQVNQMHLQSTMMHPVPRALVDGQIVGEGDFIGAVRVVRIELSRIVIEKQGVQFEITLK